MIFYFFYLLIITFENRATTHSDLVVRAKKLDAEVKVIYNASVMNAVGVCGLQLYRYGETVSLPFFTETWRPDSFYEKIQRNRGLGLHTLCLLGNCIIHMLLISFGKYLFMFLILSIIVNSFTTRAIFRNWMWHFNTFT